MSTSSEGPDRWYSWSTRQWNEASPRGYRKAAVQGPEPASYVDGLSREDRRAHLAAAQCDAAATG